MQKNTVDEFKKAVKEKYELEKLGVHSSFLLQPSRAKLRDLCAEIFKENPTPSDLMCFRAFLGFEFHNDHLRKLKTATDKFRPIETFFKGETELNDLESVQMAAILVDFSPRPYLKFAKLENEKAPKVIEKQDLTAPPEVVKSSFEKTEDLATNELVQLQPSKKFIYKKPLYWIAPLVIIVSAFYGYKAMNTKECMQWNNDHYEIVDCKTEQIGLIPASEKMPINEQLLILRKIKVCDTTTFFKQEKALVWYCKKDRNQIEFFNGPGFHPENGKPLKPITDYMINKYVIKKHQIPN